VTTPQGEAQEQQPAQPQYVTKEDMARFADEILSRAKQSDRDRSKAITTQLDEIKGMLAKAGTTLAPDQEAKLRDQIADQIDVVEQPQAGQSAAQPQATPSPVDKFLANVFAREGAVVTVNHPEWKLIQDAIDKNWNNPEGMADVLAVTIDAARALKARTAAMQETAAARVGGGGSQQTTGSALDNATGLDLLKEAYKKR
jgi:hypothetical protein